VSKPFINFLRGTFVVLAIGLVITSVLKGNASAAMGWGCAAWYAGWLWMVEEAK